MAQSLTWSPSAIRQFKAILDYWQARNGSVSYCERLVEETDAALKRVIKFPESGLPTSSPTKRYILLREYRIYYSNRRGGIRVLAVWDSRQDPASLNRDLR